MNNDYTEALELLDEAAETIEMALDLLRQVQHEVPALRHRMDAYLISTLEQALSDDNEWLGGSNSANIASLRVEVEDLAGGGDADEDLASNNDGDEDEDDCIPRIVRALTLNGCPVYLDEIELVDDGASFRWVRKQTTGDIRVDEFSALFKVWTWVNEAAPDVAPGQTWEDLVDVETDLCSVHFTTNKEELDALLALFDDTSR